MPSTDIFDVYQPLQYAGNETAALPFHLHSVGHIMIDGPWSPSCCDGDVYYLMYTPENGATVRHKRKNVHMESHNMIFAPSEGFISLQPDAKQTEVYWIAVTGESLPVYDRYINAGRLSVVSEEQRINVSFFQVHFSEIRMCLKQDDISLALMTSGAVSYLLQYLTEHTYLLQIDFSFPKSKLSMSIEETVNDANEYMEQHYAEKISVEEMAAKYYMSPHHFIKLYKKQTGITPYFYLTGIRIDHAKRMLLSTDTNIEMIARQCGFGDGKNMGSSFKRNVGTTPGKYRDHKLIIKR